MIGSLGRVVFSVSTKKVLTFKDFSKKKEARYHEHAIIARKPKLEYLGEGLDEISFSISLDQALGVVPADEIAKLENIASSGKAESLVIGGKFIALFVITSISESWKNVDGRGVLRAAELAIILREYPDD